VTFVAGLRPDGLTAPFVIDCAMNGAIFIEYLRQRLVPTLRPGDIVIKAIGWACLKRFQGMFGRSGALPVQGSLSCL
jgi:hypothetical protein